MKVLPLALLALAIALAPVRPSLAAEPPRPNIIFVLTDDLGYGDYGVFFQNARREKGDRSQPWHMTPQIDAMAAQGLQLRQHYCPAPVCAPSRASLLLGVTQGHANVRDNQFDKALEQNHTLASVLKGAGYATAAIGKWGLQGEGTGPDTWPAYPTKRGFDYYYGSVRHMDGHFHYPREDGREVWENEREVSNDLAGCYTTDLFTGRAKKWIADHRAAQPEQPFFLYLAYDTPHAKLQLPPSPFPTGGGLKGGVQWTGEPGHMLNTAGAADSYIHPDYAGATWLLNGKEQPWPDVDKRYATDVRRIDDCLGDLLQLLRDLKIDEQTLVIFTTDNGPSRESYLPAPFEPTFFSSFGPFDGIKRDCWEGGIRVGALARWPGQVPAGQVSELPCQSQDWMPTFAELAGVPTPARADGVSLVPTLTGHGEQQTPLVYVEYAQADKTPGYAVFEPAHRDRVRRQMQMIRMGDFVGVRYDVQAHADPFEIYDVVTDPKEAHDLAAQRPELQQRMHDRVLEVRRPEPTAPRPYDWEMMPAFKITSAGPNALLQLFPAYPLWLPRYDKRSGKATAELPTAADNGDALWSGFLKVPADGVYTFTLPAGAEALLRIHQATVLDAAFTKAETAVSGAVALRAGLHPFRLYARSVRELSALRWSGPSFPAQPVPAEALWH